GKKPTGGFETDGATSATKLTVPHAANVAAKCAPRTKISGSDIGDCLGSFYGPTRKLKSPCIRCVSTDRTRHLTLYVPGDRALSGTRSCVRSRRSTLAFPACTGAPFSSRTSILLKVGSS